MSTVYFCWLCGRPADPEVPPAPHYEETRLVRFCSWRHRSPYLWLAAL